MTHKPACEHGDCRDHYGDPAAWCEKCAASSGEAERLAVAQWKASEQLPTPETLGRAIQERNNWADTAAFHCRNEQYWRERAEHAEAELARLRWQPIETAPKGTRAERTTDPGWVQPPTILVRRDDDSLAVVRWDWYFAPGGNGYRGGHAWTVPGTGYPCEAIPTHWMPLPAPPAALRTEDQP